MNDSACRAAACRALGWLLAWATVVGCADTPRDKAGADPAAARPADSADNSAAVRPAVELTVVDGAGFEAAIDRLAGRVVLVDCWATWCRPCIEQLPHTLELAERQADGGLAVVTLSFDDPATWDRVAALLAAQGAAPEAENVAHLISQFGGSPQSAEVFDVAGGALPHYKLFDRAGRLQQTFALDPAAEEQFTPADVDAAVAQLLAQRQEENTSD